MESRNTGERKWRVRPLRLACQILVLAALVVVPFFSSNPVAWSPSRIALGQLPPPATFPVSGDTWSLAVGDFRLTHPLAFADAWLAAKAAPFSLLVSALIPLAATLILGRFFCSWLCPVGFLLELNMKVHGFFKRKGLHYEMPLWDFRYLILTVALIFGFFFAMPILSIFDPPHLLGRELMYLFTHHQVSMSGAGFLAGILLLEMFTTSRLWCNSLCPSGGGLSLLGKKRLWRIAMWPEKCTRCEQCNDMCPYNLAPMMLADRQPFDWTTCDNCGRCRDACPTGAVTYAFKTIGRASQQI